MSLPFYHIYTPRSSSYEDLDQILHEQMNLKHPVVISLKNLEFNVQREFIGLIENYFSSKNLNFNFPYPVYVLTDHESSISNLPLIAELEELPIFYKKKEGKMNVKESHLLSKNKLLQQEIHNTDSKQSYEALENFGRMHRIIFDLETERLILKELMTKIQKVKNG
ncbi:MAG TPA: hypothetical protein VKY27_08540 [Bacteriovoracaceae bacterium]|nr:hypothetical protein [Bacteriovoracaceae bacterium]